MVCAASQPNDYIPWINRTFTHMSKERIGIYGTQVLHNNSHTVNYFAFRVGVSAARLNVYEFRMANVNPQLCPKLSAASVRPSYRSHYTYIYLTYPVDTTVFGSIISFTLTLSPLVAALSRSLDFCPHWTAIRVNYELRRYQQSK